MANRKLENKLLGGFVGFLLVIFGVQGLDTVNPDLFKGALAPNIYGNVQVAPKPIMMAHSMSKISMSNVTVVKNTP